MSLNQDLSVHGVGTAKAKLNLAEYKNAVTALGGETNIAIGITEYNSGTDSLSVYHNNVYLHPGNEYTIAADGASIDLNGYTAVADETFYFHVLKNVEATGTSYDGTLIQDGTIDKIKLSTTLAGELDGKASTSHTHAVASATADGFMALGDKSKLDGIQAGAQVNAVDSVNGKTGAVSLGAADVSAIPTTEKGSASGVASLDASGQVPASQLGNAGGGDVVKIDSAVLSASSASVSFSSIPQTYSALKIVFKVRSTDTANTVTYFVLDPNGTSNSNKSSYTYVSEGTTPSSETSTDIVIASRVGTMSYTTANGPVATGEVIIPGYANTNDYKTFTSHASSIFINGTGEHIVLHHGAGTYTATNAISSITFRMLSGSINANSEVHLYGIK